MSRPLHLRVFLSSPGDVAAERKRAAALIRGLQHQPLLSGKVTLQLVASDDVLAGAPLRAGVEPQRSVDTYKGRPGLCDLTVVILWSRLGTPVTGDDGRFFVSGTAYELEDARRAGKPVFVYVRTQTPHFDEGDGERLEKQRQYDELQLFVKEICRPNSVLRGGVNFYATETEFSTRFEQHLEAEVRRHLEAPRRRYAVVGLTLTIALLLLAGIAWESRSVWSGNESSNAVPRLETVLPALPMVDPGRRASSTPPTKTAGLFPKPGPSSTPAGRRPPPTVPRACSTDASCRRCRIGAVSHPETEYDALAVEQLKLRCARDRAAVATLGNYSAPCVCDDTTSTAPQ